MKSLSSYPEPFNPKPPKFSPGERVINDKGHTGIIVSPEDAPDYAANRPGSKWELVEWDNFSGRTWVGNIWIKRL